MQKKLKYLLPISFLFSLTGVIALFAKTPIIERDIHAILHLITILLAIVLCAISFNAYQKDKRERFFYICIAFFIFLIREILIAVDILIYPNSVLLLISHFLNLTIILLFLRGITK